MEQAALDGRRIAGSHNDTYRNISHIKGRTYIEGVSEQGTEENTWT
jgi:hypothetical protein